MLDHRVVARLMLLSASILLSRGTEAGQFDDAAPTLWHDLEVPGGTAGLARAAGLPADTEPWRLIPDVVRRLQPLYEERDPTTGAAARIAAYLDSLPPPGQVSVARGEADPADGGNGHGEGLGGYSREREVIPLPLSPEAWLTSVFRDRVEPHALLRMLATDRAAGLLYRGLLALDAPTLAAVSEPRTLAALYERHADTFHLLAPAFRVRDGRVAVPGGAGAAWESVTGAAVTEPATFLLRLLRSHGGALAVLYANVAGCEPPEQAWVLALREPAPERRRQLRALVSVVARQPRWWRMEKVPVLRPQNDLAFVLGILRVTPEGGLGLSERRAWQAVFEGANLRSADRSPAEPSWLLSRILGVAPEVGLDRLRTVAFTQRVFGAVPESAVDSVVQAAQGFRRYPALALTLERLGVRNPRVYAAAAGRAAKISAIHDQSRAAVALAQFQGTLALIERAHATGVLSDEQAAELASRLLTALYEEGEAAGSIGAWIRTALVPELATATGAPQSASAEEVAVRALAGRRADPVAIPTIEWEGLSYRVDVAGFEERRLRAVRSAQGPPRLDDGLAVPAQDSRDSRERRRALERADALLAEALTALAYAAHLQEPETGISEHAARRHRFAGEVPPGQTLTAPWSVPRVVWGAGTPWHVRGSLLALEVPLALQYLRRADARPPPAPPRLEGTTRQAFAETAALLSPFSLSEREHAAVVDALRRGRERISRAVHDAGERGRLAAVVGGARPQPLLDWVAARGPEAFARLFTLSDVWRAGAPEAGAVDGWGTVGLRTSACLCLRMPRAPSDDALVGRLPDGSLAERVADLNLRIAEELAELGLPAVLAPYLLRIATQHLVDELEPAYVDDPWAPARYTRRLSRERVEDYVSTLATSVLVPVTE